jgi:catechol 2,3-dioxygenase
VLGFELTQRLGSQAAFVSAGGYHHHIGLNTWESRGGAQPPPGSTGLFHVAILYPSRALLADALRRLLAASIPLDGASDHGVSEAIYLRDPDGNGKTTLFCRSVEETRYQNHARYLIARKELFRTLGQLGEISQPCAMPRRHPR